MDMRFTPEREAPILGGLVIRQCNGSQPTAIAPKLAGKFRLASNCRAQGVHFFRMLHAIPSFLFC
jgi:hypothetical protein